MEKRTFRSMISLLLASRSSLRALSLLGSGGEDSGSGGGGDVSFALFDVSVAVE